MLAFRARNRLCLLNKRLGKATCDQKNLRLLIMLACIADGDRLPTTVNVSAMAEIIWQMSSATARDK